MVQTFMNILSRMQRQSQSGSIKASLETLPLNNLQYVKFQTTSKTEPVIHNKLCAKLTQEDQDYNLESKASQTSVYQPG